MHFKVSSGVPAAPPPLPPKERRQLPRSSLHSLSPGFSTSGCSLAHGAATGRRKRSPIHLQLSASKMASSTESRTQVTVLCEKGAGCRSRQRASDIIAICNAILMWEMDQFSLFLPSLYVRSPEIRVSVSEGSKEGHLDRGMALTVYNSL